MRKLFIATALLATLVSTPARAADPAGDPQELTNRVSTLLRAREAANLATLATVVGCQSQHAEVHTIRPPQADGLFALSRVGEFWGADAVDHAVQDWQTPVLLVVADPGCGGAVQSGSYAATGRPGATLLRQLAERRAAEALEHFAANVAAGRMMVIAAVLDRDNAFGQGPGRLMLLSVD